MFLIKIFQLSDVTIDSTEDNSQHTSDHHQHSVVNQVQVGHQQTIFDPTGQLQYQFKAENGQGKLLSYCLCSFMIVLPSSDIPCGAR